MITVLCSNPLTEPGFLKGDNLFCLPKFEWYYKQEQSTLEFKIKKYRSRILVSFRRCNNGWNLLTYQNEVTLLMIICCVFTAWVKFTTYLLCHAANWSTQRTGTNSGGDPISMFKYKKVTKWNDSCSEPTMQQIGTNGGWESTSIFKCKKVNTQWIHSKLTHTANWPMKRISTSPHRHWCKFAAWTNLLHGVKFAAWWLFALKHWCRVLTTTGAIHYVDSFSAWLNSLCGTKFAAHLLCGVKTAAWWLFCT